MSKVLAYTAISNFWLFPFRSPTPSSPPPPPLLQPVSRISLFSIKALSFFVATSNFPCWIMFPLFLAFLKLFSAFFDAVGGVYRWVALFEIKRERERERERERGESFLLATSQILLPGNLFNANKLLERIWGRDLMMRNQEGCIRCIFVEISSHDFTINRYCLLFATLDWSSLTR